MAKSRKKSGRTTKTRRTAKSAAKRTQKRGRKATRSTGRRSTKRTARAAKARPRRKGSAAKGSSRKAVKAPQRRTGTARRKPAATKPSPTRPSTRTGAGAGVSRSPYLERERRRLREIEESVPGPPSSLDLDVHATAARSGREEFREALQEHTESSPAFTGGDLDADWQNAYATGDEAPGGDNPTPDQDRVDDIGKSLGLQYDDNEELKSVDKIADRDKHRWELDPASAEDYKERQK